MIQYYKKREVVKMRNFFFFRLGRGRAMSASRIILNVLNHSSVFQILEVILGFQEPQTAVWSACVPGLPYGDLPLNYRGKFWLRYGYLGTLNAYDQWPIDFTLQNRVHFVFIAKFVELTPQNSLDLKLHVPPSSLRSPGSVANTTQFNICISLWVKWTPKLTLNALFLVLK